MANSEWLEQFRDKTILVTGASGFIGSNVTRRLLQAGAKVRALVRNPAKATPLQDEGATIIVGDLTNVDSLRQALQRVQLVFHLAAVMGNESQPEAYFRAVNVEGTRALAELALEANVDRFIHTSTVAVYGMAAQPNTTERSPHCISHEPYTDSKLETEEQVRRMVKEKGLPAVIVQPAHVYGPEDQTWTMTPIKLMQSGNLILPNHGSGMMQPIYIDDLVDGILRAAVLGRIGEAYILGGTQPATIGEFFGYLAQMVGKDKIPSVPRWVAMTLATVLEAIAKIRRRPPVLTRHEIRFVTKRATYDISKAQQELGFNPQVTLPEGMQQVEKWVKASGISV
jgi:nucleoside-diphosphate-sugar epimerase